LNVEENGIRLILPTSKLYLTQHTFFDDSQRRYDECAKTDADHQGARLIIGPEKTRKGVAPDKGRVVWEIAANEPQQNDCHKRKDTKRGDESKKEYRPRYKTPRLPGRKGNRKRGDQYNSEKTRLRENPLCGVIGPKY